MTRRPALLLVLAVAGARALPAQRPVSAEALVDVEGWKTDSLSRLLARNGGDPAYEVRVHAWLGWQASSRLQLVALGVGEFGTAGYVSTNSEDAEANGGLELLGARWTPSPRFGLEAGKVLMPVGSFGQRHFSDVNPLVGAPDMYPPLYPWGAVASGSAGAFDWRAGVVSLPSVNTRYTPIPENRMRPVGGIGVRVGPAFRLGASATHGPYLGSRYDAQLPAGAAWTDFAQTVVAGDARFSAGRFEVRGEVAWSEYEAPTHASPLHGTGWYAEGKATLSPRVFVAARYEDYAYPFILPVNPGFWVGNVTTQHNAEVGGGYRFTPSALLKVSFRKDDWPQPHPPGVTLANGYAVAVQFSWRLYLTEMLARRY